MCILSFTLMCDLSKPPQALSLLYLIRVDLFSHPLLLVCMYLTSSCAHTPFPTPYSSYAPMVSLSWKVHPYYYILDDLHWIMVGFLQQRHTLILFSSLSFSSLATLSFSKDSHCTGCGLVNCGAINPL